MVLDYKDEVLGALHTRAHACAEYNLRMLSRALFVVCALLSVGVACAQSPAKPQHLTALSYNIHYAVGMDGKTDLARIARVIRDSKAGIVGLQEISNKAMAEELGRLTKMKAVFGRSKEKDSQYGDAILCRYPFTYVGNESIPSASSSRYQAMAVDVDVSDVFGGDTKVRFVNTHFDWLPSIGSQEARLAACEVIERAFFTGYAEGTAMTRRAYQGLLKSEARRSKIQNVVKFMRASKMTPEDFERLAAQDAPFREAMEHDRVQSFLRQLRRSRAPK